VILLVKNTVQHYLHFITNEANGQTLLQSVCLYVCSYHSWYWLFNNFRKIVAQSYCWGTKKVVGC